VDPADFSHIMASKACARAIPGTHITIALVLAFDGTFFCFGLYPLTEPRKETSKLIGILAANLDLFTVADHGTRLVSCSVNRERISRRERSTFCLCLDILSSPTPSVAGSLRA
jgi:hypothetical protein